MTAIVNQIEELAKSVHKPTRVLISSSTYEAMCIEFMPIERFTVSPALKDIHTVVTSSGSLKVEIVAEEGVLKVI